MRIKIVSAVAALVTATLPVVVAAHRENGHSTLELPTWQRVSVWPVRVVSTFAGDPAATVSLNWRTAAGVTGVHAGATLRYAAYTADGDPNDPFELQQTEDGAKRLITAPRQHPVTRSFDNSLP